MAATLVVILIGLCVAQFGRRFASSGSLYSYVALGPGPAGAFAAGWGLVMGYTCIAMIGVVGSGVYLGSFLSTLGVPGASTVTQLILYLVCSPPWPRDSRSRGSSCPPGSGWSWRSSR